MKSRAGTPDADVKFDRGKSCVRFKRIEDLPLGVIGEAVGRGSVDRSLGITGKSRKRK